ncbi:MAG: hypothetical protein MRY49_02940 [Candidatus Pacebacteria bacterium]|nr:hypothetical protein [Candidatus Paceibacterota bacterium]
MFAYLRWHYTRALKEGLELFSNAIYFVYHFFSIPLLFRTFFHRFSKMGEGYGRGFSPENFFSALIVNTIMRIVGIISRTVVILIGVVATLFTILLGIVAYVLWFILPIAIIFLFLKGLSILI